jgi:hypothetical protein
LIFKQAMGFQRPPSYKQKQQSVPKTTKDVEDKGDSFKNTRIPYLSPTTNEPIAFDSYYNSWVVSFFSIHAYSKHIYIHIYTCTHVLELGFIWWPCKVKNKNCCFLNMNIGRTPFCSRLIWSYDESRKKEDDCRVFRLRRHTLTHRRWPWSCLHVWWGKLQSHHSFILFALHNCILRTHHHDHTLRIIYIHTHTYKHIYIYIVTHYAINYRCAEQYVKLQNFFQQP